jgi:glycerol kinase
VSRGRFLLALDQGTSSSRAIVFDERARPVGSAQQEVISRYPRPGWVEQDPEQLFRGLLQAARDSLQQAGLASSDLAAIGITNQRETTVAWGRDGKPAPPAIVWQDRRTSERCAVLRAAGHEAEVRAVTGLLLDPYFSATKMSWLLESLADGRRRAADGELLLGTVDTYLLWRLSGGSAFATDVSNASRTMLLDLRERCWSERMLSLFEVPGASLPEVLPTDADFGTTEPDLLGTPVPIRAMVGDQQAALFGQACFDPGSAKNTYGTGCFLLLTTGDEAPSAPRGLLATVAWQRTATPQLRYAIEGSVFVAGAAVRWLRDGLGIIGSAEEVESLAASVPDSGGVVVVPAFAGLGAPHWDPDARGLITGITGGTRAAHIARATLESIAQQTVDLIDALEAGGAPPLTSLRADGGAAVDDLLLQIQADLLGRPVERAAFPETTALGAALLAGRAAGVWESDEEAAALAVPGRIFEPQREAAWRDGMRGRWADALARARSSARRHG